MTPAKLTLPVIYRGATYRHKLTWYSRSPNPINPSQPIKTPTDLTGCSAQMKVRDTLESATVLLELSTANGGIVLGGVAGTINFYIADTATALMSWKAGKGDLIITFGNGDKLPIVELILSTKLAYTR